jgi:hypothetical protein
MRFPCTWREKMRSVAAEDGDGSVDESRSVRQRQDNE